LIVDISVGGVEDRAALPFFSDVPPAPCILARLFSATGPLARIARLTHRAERRAHSGQDDGRLTGRNGLASCTYY
jgi:hypothetical protein